MLDSGIYLVCLFNFIQILITAVHIREANVQTSETPPVVNEPTFVLSPKEPTKSNKKRRRPEKEKERERERKTGRKTKLPPV